MKYEAVFGNQDLFDGASKYAVIAIKRPFISGVRSEEMYFFSSTFDAVMKAGSSFNFNNVILKTAEYAERSIIQEPKRWTAEDQKAGRSPDVGSMVMVTSVDECASVAAINNDAVCVVFHDGEFTTLHKSGISPIETPEEKERRLRSKWVELVRNKAMISADEYTTEAIYDALLSGTLSVPTKGGE